MLDMGQGQDTTPKSNVNSITGYHNIVWRCKAGREGDVGEKGTILCKKGTEEGEGKGKERGENRKKMEGW